MNQKEILLESTESYLCSIMSEVADLTITTNDSSTPFLELGIDSFRILQIIKKLEEVFGTLPKTLLFENFNISDLSNHFVENYEEILNAKFADQKFIGKPTIQSANTSVEITQEETKVSQPESNSVKIATQPAEVTNTTIKPEQKVSNNEPKSKSVRNPIIISEKEAMIHPELKDWYQTTFNQYKNESSASRGTRNIAPLLFIGSEKKGYLNYSKSNNIILVYGYTGPASYLSTIAEEISQYCEDSGFEITILSDHAIESIGENPYYATPFGIISRIENIKNFSLEGSKMRRLRYQVSKFENAGECKTVEYINGTDKETDKNIATLIDEWCAPRTMVNPLIHIVKQEILVGKLSTEHRLFLTYLDNVLQNAILISPLSSEINGYLMDLEFYPSSMLLGGLEYGIVKMMEILASEGSNMLSLGGTYGCKMEESENADPELDKTLNFLRDNKIFNDEGNLQFKNKFRPSHQTIFICRPKAISNADNVTDIIMMIADPSKMEVEAEEKGSTYTKLSLEIAVTTDKNEEVAKTETAITTNISVETKAEKIHVPTENTAVMIEENERSLTLAEFNFNPLNIPSTKVAHDLKTDSWAQLESPVIDAHLNFLHSQLYKTVNINESLQSVFPFSHISITSSGRNAEKAFFKSWNKKGIAVQNLLFATTIYHEIENGFSPKEIPHTEVFKLNSEELFKGNLHWEALEKEIEKEHKSISFVAIEISNNAAGGAPVSIQHLKEVKKLLSKYSIPLVMDGTRVLENAKFIIENEKEYAGKTIWEVARNIYSCADAVWASLPKDFCINKGGIIATNDEALYNKVQDVIEDEGIGLDIIDKKLIAISFENKNILERRITNRIENVKLIHDAVSKHGIPIFKPVGTHCILIDVKQIPEFKSFENPVTSFNAWMFLNTGIRGGAHNAGMQKNSAINDVVRLAIHVGIEQKEATEIANKLIQLFKNMENIPELLLQGNTEAYGTINATYTLKQYHNVSKNIVPIPDQNTTAVAEHVNVTTTTNNSTAKEATQKQATSTDRKYQIEDIAIVGMSGRYPKAKNLDELWDNLIQGKDCVETIPEERLKQRKTTKFSKKYRGGFLSDVDKFDSMFFNISPAVAEMFDPQERLLLETAWESIEDAGYYPEILTPENTPKNIGVFVGAVWTMYQMIGAEEKLVGKDVNPNSFLWSVANRISYCLNLSGPSLSVDTACSSSMTALYLACEAIYNGECSGAIVGGVNLDLHASKFDINSFGGALSPDGVCRTFGKGANGYVAGEGVGTIFIKPLKQAIEDGDHIHGVIKSVAVNHGGRTSGYMVPDPKAQGNLIGTALEKGKVDARTVGYIEAHGTGTELGDPIEIAGLQNAFKKYSVENQTCAVGSVKTNIGHLEAAAGVVGIHKVLLQMRHKKLVPSLHSAELNEFIDFTNSPFYVEQEFKDWKPKTIDGVQFPLRAGISSFGAGGANAHVIIESYENENKNVAVEEAPTYQIFPLSALKKDRLIETATRLLKFLEHDVSLKESSQVHINDIGHTLRVGRKSFEHRLVIIAATKQELIEKLGLFIEDKNDANTLKGVVEKVGNIARLLSKSEKKSFVELIAKSGNLQKLGQLWIEGIVNDWQDLNSAKAGKRVSLPTYPFADKRHWVETSENGTVLAASTIDHPLIDANESTFERQIFKKTFNDTEFFIYDHLVSDIPTLPGVAYLDFARKAGELAAGRKVKAIKNIVWLNPITVTDSKPVDIWIELIPQAVEVKFEIFGKNVEGVKQLHSQGRIAYVTDETEEVIPEYIDIKAIQARCTKVGDGKDAYPIFGKLGLGLGPSFQVLQEVFKNDDEMFGIMKVPDVCLDDFQDFILHPSLLDGAGQTVMASHLLAATDDSGGMVVPYSFGEVVILHPLTTNCYSYIQKVDDPKSKLSKANLIITDEDGKILVKINESIGIPLTDIHEKPAGSPEAGITAEVDEFEDLYYTNLWEESQVTIPQAEANTQHSILLFDTDEKLYNAYQKDSGKNIILIQAGKAFKASGENKYTINPENKDDYIQLLEAIHKQGNTFGKICYAWSKSPFQEEEAFLNESLDTGIYSFLYVCQSLIHLKSDTKFQVVYLFNGIENEYQPHNEAVSGFIKSLHLEQSNIMCKTVEIQNNDTPTDIVKMFVSELHTDTIEDLAVRYQKEQRFVRKLKNIQNWNDEKSAISQQALKEKGVYLITGGVGGLGFIFAEYLAKECKARLILTGRSKLSEEKSIQINELEALGAEVLYLPTDVSKLEEVTKLVTEGKKKFGTIDGIIHSAGVLRDSNVRSKTREEMSAVFAPKIYGAFYLDELTKNDKLDFFVTFSSMAAVGGNMGQSDYSYANHFMDTYMKRRTALEAKGERSGKSLSLNWSIWASGGMKLDTQMEAFFKNSLGIRPLSTAVGIGTFTKGLLSEQTQIVVVEGMQERMEIAWGIRKKAVEAVEATATNDAADSSSSGGDNEEVSKLIQKELIKIAMDFLKLEEDDVSIDKILLDIGFDSIGLATYANALNDKYGLTDITPVLFFEYPSIREITKYLATEHNEAVTKTYNLAGGGTTKSAEPTAKVTTETKATPEAAPTFTGINKGWNAGQATQNTNNQPAQSGGLSVASRFIDCPIAIVGIGGVMPKSRDMVEYWENLKNGENMISVIPRDRWIWEDYDGDPITEVNKTNSKWGGFIDDADKFDPLFFGISPREAEMMDPQQRVFLETVWSTIEDSGYKISDLSGTKTGLFVGVAVHDYADLMNTLQVELDGYTASGNSHCMLVNRISFLLNLRGPSAPIDTACSSSLIAIHRAVESIHTGSSDMAIVGGVQLMMTPAAHISFGMAGMLSTDGKCKTFDESASGYVRGEGSGAVFLKTLAQAEEDNDQIYAVIKSTAENHGGRAAMLTAPNPNAQAELIVEAYEKAEIDPATVGYIECHGTGTSLGDPIEVRALAKSFKELYQKHNKTIPSTPHIGLSSVKTNIGHLETAAGISSFLKAVLAMKHKQIPASLHFENLNPHINFAGTPFYVVDKTTDWKRITGADGKEFPRRAGISSFGFGGANAHVVIEEYIPSKKEEKIEFQKPFMFTLSAKNTERLKVYAESILRHVDNYEVDLLNLTYTLQIGRDAMTQRLGFAVNSLSELKQLLSDYIAGNDIENIYQGKIKSKKEKAELESLHGSHETSIDAWIVNYSYEEMLKAWVEGFDFDWNRIYGEAKPKRINIPTYPFAKERYWFEFDPNASRGKTTAVIHPLLHTNTSVLKQQAYTSSFNENEFFLTDDKVSGKKKLAAGAFLEMANVAVTHAAFSKLEFTALEFKNMNWSSPFLANKDTSISLALYEEDENNILFEAFSSEEGEEVVHFDGKAILDAQTKLQQIDIELLKNQLNTGKTNYEELFKTFIENGLNGYSYPEIKFASKGHKQFLMQLVLPTELQNDTTDYILNPAIIEVALHASGLMIHADHYKDKSPLPAKLERLKIVAPCENEMYIWVRHSRSNSEDENHIELDIDLINAKGEICISLKSITFVEENNGTTNKFESHELEQYLESFYDLIPNGSPGKSSESINDEFQRLLGEDFSHRN
ncbi:Polyketide synthase PksN [Kordia antarctica]|uniref:Polyketide synthase PksN n=1 Tax=Kordia antarctica TaxID=1218801 RepID=A0A7L4ZI56_9FLAO|nr:SDR family NAD(P)-dependent oxidoreductase [Kordia antarctica]QHI36109.1 Polyketide synthase PksN [Kordia antarctica]